MRKPTYFRLVLAGLAYAACLALAGCSAGKPALPGDLAAAETLPVKKKVFILFSGERIAFGDWRVHQVERDTSHSIQRPRHSRIEVALKETYTFRLSGGGSPEWRAECRNQGSRQDEIPFLGPLRERGYRISLQCDLKPEGAAAAWRLDLAEADSEGGVLKGVLAGQGEELKVAGSRSLGDQVREDGHTWFEFSRDGAVVGAVVRTRDERVLFHRTAANGSRPALAAAAAALLLYLDSNERMKSIVEARLQADRMMFL